MHFPNLTNHEEVVVENIDHGRQIWIWSLPPWPFQGPLSVSLGHANIGEVCLVWWPECMRYEFFIITISYQQYAPNFLAIYLICIENWGYAARVYKIIAWRISEGCELRWSSVTFDLKPNDKSGILSDGSYS